MAAAVYPLVAPRRISILAAVPELFARFSIGGFFLLFAWQLGGDFFRTGRPTDLLLLICEGLVVVFTCFRRRAQAVDQRMIARVVTITSMLTPLLVRPIDGAGLISETVATSVGMIGLVIVIGGKISLGYSFGILPANRGVVDGGLYRIVRHPIYLGYLISHAPFLLAHPTVWNMLVFITGDVALVVRSVYEERTLLLDPHYARYWKTVRWKLVPGVY
jgi:protein-S-isoprenylcysteine O-methyltransferase Ste14